MATLKPIGSERRRGTPIPSAQDFEKQFRQAFGREMTVDERRYFFLTDTQSNEESNDGLKTKADWN